MLAVLSIAVLANVAMVGWTLARLRVMHSELAVLSDAFERLAER